MEWLAWVVLAALATASVVWIVRRFRAENRRIDGTSLRDFDHEFPRREPGCGGTRATPTSCASKAAVGSI